MLAWIVGAVVAHAVVGSVAAVHCRVSYVREPADSDDLIMCTAAGIFWPVYVWLELIRGSHSRLFRALVARKERLALPPARVHKEGP